MSSNTYTVYRHLSPSGKSYVGFTKKTMEERFQWHIYDANSGINRPFSHAIRKYGADNFESEILWQGVNRDEAIEKERFYIEHYGTFGKNGYNCTKGGAGAEGWSPSDEIRKKMSVAQRGKTLSDEHKKKIGEANRGEKNGFYGKTHTDETRKKISDLLTGMMSGENHPFYGKTGDQAPRYGKTHTEETKKRLREFHLGRKHTEETKKKMSESRRGEKHPMYGKHHSDEAKKKMSESRRGKIDGAKNPNAKPANIYCYHTDKLIAENVIIGVWAKENGYGPKSLHRTANGRVKQYKGIYARRIV